MQDGNALAWSQGRAIDFGRAALLESVRPGPGIRAEVRASTQSRGRRRERLKWRAERRSWPCCSKPRTPASSPRSPPGRAGSFDQFL